MTFRGRLGRLVSGAPDGAPAATPASHRKKRATKGKMLRAKPPNVIGKGPLLGGPGFGVVIVCIVKDEADYLEEWIAYHVALGVGHFVIYDNGSTDDSAALLERFITHGLVTRIDWPLGGGQLAAYNHSLRMFGATAKWLAYYDVDEFLVPLGDNDIPSMLERFEDAAVVRVPRLEFGYSGHRTAPTGLTIDEYTQVANVLDLDPKLPPRVKSIVQPAAVSAVDIHLAFPADVAEPGMPTETAEESVRGIAQLNHYYTRSLEEFEAKRYRGSATGRIARRAVPFDLPTIETNEAARRYSEQTQETMDQLARLDPKPYGYGSQLKLEYFPRPNDLFRFAEFAIANTAAGWEEPGRAPAFRLKNLHDGIGLVADLAESDYEPVRDGLTMSIHTQALVEHMRGQVVASLVPAEATQFIGPAGAIDVPDAGPWLLAASDEGVRFSLALPDQESARCYSLGFVLATEGDLDIAAGVEDVNGTVGTTLTAHIPASRCVAGVVEVQPAPMTGAARLTLAIDGDAAEVRIYDLFVIATG